jgi:branched-subunit amino acid ABC-type transport system permease component
VAFLASALVGAVLERSVIRFLYGRPLETLLATWGISLMLMQLVRTSSARRTWAWKTRQLDERRRAGAAQPDAALQPAGHHRLCALVLLGMAC